MIYPNVVVHMHTVCIYSYIYIKYITKILRLVLHTYYRMMKSGTFSKRSGAATKGFKICEFWFQMVYFNLNAYALG